MQSEGYSLLETALFFILFSILLMMGGGLWHYLGVTRGLGSIVERYALSSAVGTVTQSAKTGAYDSSVEMVVKSLTDSSLSQISVSDQALKDLIDELDLSSAASVALEFAVTAVRIDEQTGAVLSVESTASQNIVKRGSLDLPSFLSDGNAENGETDFDFAFRSYVQAAGATLAIPTLSYGMQGAKKKYLPEIPLVAVRALYHYRQPGFFTMLGILSEPYSWDIRVAPLRGEVS